jgi:hypothetical protein
MEKLKKGDKVYVRLKRMEGGCTTQRGNKEYPLVECVVAQVDVCGSEGCYGLEYADTREPVGLPFFMGAFEKIERA